MIRYLCFAAAFLLIAGPLRKPLFSAWRLVLPLAIGGIIGWYVLNSIRFLGMPAWIKIIGTVMVTFMIGGAIEEFFRDNSPRRRDRDAR